MTEELADINLGDLQIGPTIGVGGFGKVELVGWFSCGVVIICKF